MRYTIITPTIVRTTLPVLCESLDRQTNSSWEHLIAVDIDLRAWPNKRRILQDLPRDPRRHIIECTIEHKDSGNTCRRALSMIANGDYVHYIDDDNYYADEHVLETLERVTTAFASFSLLYRGAVQSPQPFESTNVIIRNGLHHFPASVAHDTDQVLVRNLIREQEEYEVVDDRPLVVVPYDNTGIDH